MFPLQLLGKFYNAGCSYEAISTSLYLNSVIFFNSGFDVDIINSVHFSNHTGYPEGWEGDILDGEKLLKLVNGLERNGLLLNDLTENSSEYIGHILTGYIGSESFLRSVVTVVQKLRALNSNCRYVCDPVLGDAGQFYVPAELVDIYRRDVLPLVS